jgi:peptidoglycan/xylan/chitin deacetylase (PgdA/CDA1 family)
MSAIKKILLHMIESLGGFQLLRRINKNDPVVLMYHRILQDEFINGLAPQEFERQIVYINKHFNIVSIEELLCDVKSNSVKPYSLALTFDDGHYDFYSNAWPILKKYNLPASLYITTGFVDGTTWLWPDLLKYILLNSNTAILQVENLGDISTHQKEHHISWHKLGDYCLTLSPEERNTLLYKLAADAKILVSDAPKQPFHSVTWPQLQEMHSEGLVVGSHTVTHPILSSLSRENLHYELATSASAIQQHLGAVPAGICYPNGRPEDISEAVIKAAELTGYTYGLMGRSSKLNPARPFKIGRIAANKDFFYFKWTLARRKQDNLRSYIQ